MASTAQANVDDPLEPFNRGSFAVNLTLDRYLLKPIATTYRSITPGFVKVGVTNALENLAAPATIVNSLLQGEAEQATETVGRFMFNTILGFGGFVDVGGLLGMPERHREDFGQTLAVYGVGAGPYMVVPLLGSSNPRDLAGMVVDMALDPISAIAPVGVTLSQGGAAIVSSRERNLETIDELQRTSLDFYAATRTLTTQLRQSDIRNGDPASLGNVFDEDLYDEGLYDEDLYDESLGEADSASLTSLGEIEGLPE